MEDVPTLSHGSCGVAHQQCKHHPRNPKNQSRTLGDQGCITIRDRTTCPAAKSREHTSIHPRKRSVGSQHTPVLDKKRRRGSYTRTGNRCDQRVSAGPMGVIRAVETAGIRPGSGYMDGRWRRVVLLFSRIQDETGKSRARNRLFGPP